MSTTALLAEDVRPRRRLAGTMGAGSWQRRGRIVGRLPGGGWRRVEPGTTGTVSLEVRVTGDRLVLQVWGHPSTPAPEVESALEATLRWAGLRDDPTGFADLVGPHPVLRRALAVHGSPVIGGLPRAAESFGRAVLGQLVQGVEAVRSEGQLVELLGGEQMHGLRPWPTPVALVRARAHELRRCGISLRGAGALHRFATDDRTFQRLAAARRWVEMDAALTRLPGVGGWTSAETRLWLGDPDAVSVGDYHIPAMIGWALGDRSEDDQTMLELLAPYAGQRGRVIRLVERAARSGLAPSKPRRGPRHAVSAHRYW